MFLRDRQRHAEAEPKSCRTDIAAAKDLIAQWANTDVLGSSVLAWITATALLTLFIGGGLIFRRVLIKRVDALAARSTRDAAAVVAAMIDAIASWFIVVFALFMASRPLQLHAQAEDGLSHLMVVAVLIQLGLCLASGTTQALERKRAREAIRNRGAVAAMDLLSLILRVAIWSVVFLLILSNLGVNITALVAGLGVGGIAIALAAQNILGDLFASLSIILDKPFVVGDFLAVDSYLGSVERVGIKTTRLRSLSGEQLVFSNNDLLGSRVRNYGRLHERRIVFSIGVTYETTPAKLKAIPTILREAVEAEEDVRFDRAHFKSYGDFALIFEIVYYVLVADYNRYMDIQQSINFALFERLAEEGVAFAYPTQTVYVAGAGMEPTLLDGNQSPR
ncbi:MAG: mechanosensitive ion channel family protein [Pseudomonadota bacterium]